MVMKMLELILNWEDPTRRKFRGWQSDCIWGECLVGNDRISWHFTN